MNKNISKLLEKSKRIDINEKSKLVFFSDLHRGDGGSTDCFSKNRNIYKAALNYYYKEGFTLIEIGDGDELWKNKDFRDIAYEYREIFLFLNKFNNRDRLFMLWGNHDSIKGKKNFKNNQKRILNKYGKDYGKEFLELIDNIEFYESLVLNYTPLGKEIFILHGHQFDFMNSQLEKVSRFLIRYFWRVLEGICGFKEPLTPANNYKKGSIIDDKISNWANENRKMVIAGHTHKVEFPKSNEGLYFNDGACVYNFGLTTIEIENGIISLIKWGIKVDDKNFLFIKRKVLDGPEYLSNYLRRCK